MSFRRCLLAFALSVASLCCAAQQSDSDSLVRLLSAASARQYEHFGEQIREVVGPARFLHNGTYLICDSATWYIARECIEAVGHVQIIQDQTVLTSDRLTYVIPANTAEFRGSVVQLQDKDKNTLRTRWLDYNTKDSVAVFKEGGALRDKDGQIIESTNGTYDSKIKTFTFVTNVNMFTDSIFVRARKLEYNTASAFATFYYDTDAWQDDKMISTDAGWYDRDRELFLFSRNVHGLSPDKEGWSDSLYFSRATNDVEMLGNVCLVDTVRRVTGLAGRILYVDSLSRVEMTRKPAALIVTSSDSLSRDSVWVGADTLVYRSFMKFQIDSSEFDEASGRLSAMASDAVSSYRAEAARAAREAAQKALEETEEYQNQKAAEEARNKREGNAAKGGPQSSGAASGGSGDAGKSSGDGASAGKATGGTDDTGKSAPAGNAGDLAAAGGSSEGNESSAAGADSLTAAPMDSLSLDREAALQDSLARADSIAVADSLARIPKDSTKVGFATGRGHVRLYKSDFQMACDSLRYNDIDSLVRLYKDPVVWNAGNRQYLADSIWVSFHEGGDAMDKAYLMSDAFITVEEQIGAGESDPGLYDQIRSTEMMAYFDNTNALTRFDALGDVNTVFYLKEDSVIATVNKSTAKMLMARLKDNNLETVAYFDESENDAYPLAQLKRSERTLKGFEWMPDKRPSEPSDVTDYVPRKSQREEYESHPRATFRQTEIYFPGYMDGVYKEIEEGKVRKARGKAVEDSLAAVRQDSLAAASVADSLAYSAESLPDTLSADTESDSLAAGVPVDSLASAPADSAVAAPALSEKEMRRQQQEAERKARIAAREAKWARLDSLDAAKAQAKADRKQARVRLRKAKVLLKQHEQERKDAERLGRYISRYTARRDRRSH